MRQYADAHSAMRGLSAGMSKITLEERRHWLLNQNRSRKMGSTDKATGHSNRSVSVGAVASYEHAIAQEDVDQCLAPCRSSLYLLC